MKKLISTIYPFLILLIITIPAFLSLLNNQYFSIHDDQHVARLYLLDQGIKQGYLFPRWVDTLSFGFGDPLFQFYPPFVYYLGEIFHLMGFTLITSINIVFILGFSIASIGMYLFSKEFLGKMGGYLAATIYTYFFYHAVNAYVRGALAEFFTMAVVPFILYTFYRLTKDPTVKNSLWFGITFALLPLTHQLIVFPFLFSLVPIALWSFFTVKDKIKFIKLSILGGMTGLALSTFFWLPILLEKHYTFLDQELGGYKLHYIFPQQFWYSPWGFGGSIAGAEDGVTFQLGKIPILLAIVSIILCIIFWLKKKKIDINIKYFSFLVFLFFFSIFMTTSYSAFIWDNFKLLWNLQFPWRFLVMTSVFISLVASYWVVFLKKLIPENDIYKKGLTILVGLVIIFTIVKYQPYFYPQQYLNRTDANLTTFDEIAWRQSKTVLHFVPKGVKVYKDKFGNAQLDIAQKDLPHKPYTIQSGNASVTILQNKYADKQFQVDARASIHFQLNTFHFVGWKAFIDNTEVVINDQNDYKLISIVVPAGNHHISFKFINTPSRIIGNTVSIVSFIGIILYFIFNALYQEKRKKK